MPNYRQLNFCFRAILKAPQNEASIYIASAPKSREKHAGEPMHPDNTSRCSHLSATRVRLFDESLYIVVQSTGMEKNELARLFEQQVFNELAQTAIEDMREMGKSFDELFPLHACDSKGTREFRERIKSAIRINLLPISTRGTIAASVLNEYPHQDRR